MLRVVPRPTIDGGKLKGGISYTPDRSQLCDRAEIAAIAIPINLASSQSTIETTPHNLRVRSSMNEQSDSEIFQTKLYLSPEKDELFESGPWPKPFVFNEDVVRVFDDMISRSVPLYREVLACAAHWARDYYQPGSRIVDIGCSTGTFLELLGRFLKQPATLVGIDNSQPMLEKARQKLAQIQQIHQVELICNNAENCSFENSSVVVINYTLQFLPLQVRQKLLRSIYQGLNPGGLLFLSEKVKSACPQFQETINRHYEAFKAYNGYAKTEIERKKEALENVLVPLTEAQQVSMLHESGFSHIDSPIKLHNFISLVALK